LVPVRANGVPVETLGGAARTSVRPPVEDPPPVRVEGSVVVVVPERVVVEVTCGTVEGVGVVVTLGIVDGGDTRVVTVGTVLGGGGTVVTVGTVDGGDTSVVTVGTVDVVSGIDDGGGTVDDGVVEVGEPVTVKHTVLLFCVVTPPVGVPESRARSQMTVPAAASAGMS
jgi:hypothetical protein